MLRRYEYTVTRETILEDNVDGEAVQIRKVVISIILIS